MTNRVLVTGILGFIGRHVSQYLTGRNSNVEIMGIDLSPNAPKDAPYRYSCADLSDSSKIQAVLRDFSPTHVIHLAGLVGPHTLSAHIKANLLNTDIFYDLLAKNYPETKIIQAGSAAAYGWTDTGELPISETQCLRPLGPYGISKAAQDLLAESYYRGKGLPIVRARIFNLIGPGQSEKMVPMTFVHQFNAIKNGSATTMMTGNLSPTRDFVDIRDVAAAFESLLFYGRPGEAYNIAGEKEIAIRYIIDTLIDLTGVSSKIEVDDNRVKESDIMRSYADCSKIRKHTNWVPKIKFEQSLADMWQAVTHGS